MQYCIYNKIHSYPEEKGSGPGLLLCKEMIERNRSKMWMESNANEGTTFTFSLPKD